MLASNLVATENLSWFAVLEHLTKQQVNEKLAAILCIKTYWPYTRFVAVIWKCKRWQLFASRYTKSSSDPWKLLKL